MSRRATPPRPGPVRPFHFPEVSRDRLDNGLDLRVARLAQLPTVAVNVVLRAGESALDDDRAGLAVLAGDALEGGTATRSGAELAEDLERIGAGLSVSTGWDATTVSLSCLADRLESALEILADVVLRPAFPEDEVARARDQRLARVRQREMDPGSLAADEAARRVYADGVPYGRAAGGTEASLQGLGAEHVRGFAEARYRPNGAGIVVVGDVDAGEVGRRVRACFSGWSGDADGGPPVDARPRPGGRTVHLVHRPGSVQTALRLAHVGVPKASPDHFPLIVTNAVLGGTFTSRLNLNLRERHGFTYGVRSRFAFRRSAGPFSVSTAVGTDVTPDAIREIVHEVEAMAGSGPTGEETDAARDYVSGVFPLRMETTGQVAARLAELIVHDLPDDYHATYRERIRAVDPERAAAAAARHIRPGELRIVAVGDAEALEAPLRALELGPVEVQAAPR